MSEFKIDEMHLERLIKSKRQAFDVLLIMHET